MQKLQYHVRLAEPAAHLFYVQCRIAQPNKSGQCVSLPAWIPGSYMIRDFARHIVQIDASCDGQAVAMQHIDKDSWRCEPCDGELVLDYIVYAWDASIRGAHLDTAHAFFNGSSLFLRVPECSEQPCSLHIHPPPAELAGSWRVLTMMQKVECDDSGFGQYRAANYEELIDHPVAIGEFVVGKYKVLGVEHAIAFFGRQRADIDRVCKDLTAICRQHARLFNDELPMLAYTFITRVVNDGYGGIEHRASSALICSRDSLPVAGDASMSEAYREFLGLCSHEYFHLWNIKRIKPAAFVPYDLRKETYTEQLWVFEGITSYYDDLTLLRSGVIEVGDYLQLLGQTITRVLRNKGRFKQTVAESSFYAWNKFYKQDENSQNAIVSYYSKGALIALLCDLIIRVESAGKASLDDIMRELWRHYGEPGVGVTDGVAEQLLEQHGGEEMAAFLPSALHSTEELPLAKWLQRFGVKMHLRAAESQADKGGKDVSEQPAVELGACLKEKDGYTQVVTVTHGSAAQLAGLWAGDLLVACNGLKASMKRLESELSRCQPGDIWTLQAFRDDELLCFQVALLSPEHTTCYLTLDEEASQDVVAARNSWLAVADT